MFRNAVRRRRELYDALAADSVNRAQGGGLVTVFLRNMYARLIAEITSEEMFADVSREWLTSTMTEVFPALWEGLRTRPVSRVPIHPARGPWGQPGHVRGVLTISRNTPVDWRDSLYSERSWPRFLARLDEYPFGAMVTVNALDERGLPVDGGEADVHVARDSSAPAWAEFTFGAPAVGTGWPESAPLQDEWAQFVKGQAARIGACAGGMTDDHSGGAETGLERALHRGVRPLGGDLREVLRGYSWITIVAPELVSRLGGVGALAASGAFCEVSPLPDGSLWLRATPTVNEFTGARIHQVFEALAPVLLTGTAKLEYKAERYRIVEGVDAADYQ
jgi:hypothetical protein